MSLLSLMDGLNMVLIPSLAMILSVISQNSPMPLGMFMTLLQSFIGISTFSQQQIHGDDEFLVVHPESFTDKDCPRIHALLSRFVDYIQAGSKKRKRLLGDDGWNGHRKGKRRVD